MYVSEFVYKRWRVLGATWLPRKHRQIVCLTSQLTFKVGGNIYFAVCALNAFAYTVNSIIHAYRYYAMLCMSESSHVCLWYGNCDLHYGCFKNVYMVLTR